MKTKRALILFLVGLVIVISTGLFVYHNENRMLIKNCPDEWVEDRMPGAGNDSAKNQYFIINGERKELRDYDLEWIRSNCSVQIQYVY